MYDSGLGSVMLGDGVMTSVAKHFDIPFVTSGEHSGSNLNNVNQCSETQILNDDHNNNQCTSLNSGQASTYQTLKLLSWNIQGIGKTFEISEITQLVKNNDIIFLSETMKLDSFQANIDGYKYFHCQRNFQHPKARRPSGGIAVLIKNALCTTKTVSIVKAKEHVIWLKISSSNQSEIYLGGLYIPPQGRKIHINSSYSNDIYNQIREDIA